MKKKIEIRAGRWLRIIGCGLTAGMFLYCSPFFSWAEESEQVFVQGTVINGLGISNMTVQEAKKQISGFYESDYLLTIHERGNKTEQISGTEIGLTVGISEEFLQEILEKQNASGRLYGPDVDHHYRTELAVSYDEDALKEKICQLDVMTGTGMIPVQDAHVSGYEEGKEFVIVPEVRGNQADREKTQALIQQAVLSGVRELDLEAEGCYYEPKVTSGDEQLQQLCDTMNRCRGMQVVYRFGEEMEILDSSVICSWLTGTENGQIAADRDQMSAYVKLLAEKYDTAGTERRFVTVSGKEVWLTGPYGWKINQPGEVDALYRLIQTGESVEREPVYSGTAATRQQPEWGMTYVEIDLNGQHVYMVKEGAVVWDAPCVTGNLSKKYDTPAGLYRLAYKEKDRVLRGEKRADGTYEYESPVSYWMPFNGGIGLHDANWRGSFGGEIYKTNGSHGCINLPPQKAGALYDLVEKGMPVICY